MSSALPSYFRYWGKADPARSGEPKWHPLAYHCLDVAAVGTEYLRRVPAIAALIRHAFRAPEDSVVEQWCAFWLGIHDLGKFSESFQSQRPDLFFELRGREPDPAKSYRVRHDTLGMLFWKDVLSVEVSDGQWFGKNSENLMDGLDYWARAVTGHHGEPPREEGDHWTQHFAECDRLAITEFVDELRALLIDDGAAAFPRALDPDEFYQASCQFSWWIAGMAVLADWLGSNTDFFDYRRPEWPQLPLPSYWAYARSRAVQALDAAGVLSSRTEREWSLAELFPSIVRPSPLQDWAARVALCNEPQIHLLEDVTGAGKTEAAVMLAHRLVALGCVDGFFIGLPTMATANAMYDRIAQVYRRLFGTNASLALAHGHRELVERFAKSILPPGRQEHDRQQVDDTATARCTAWLADHNKRALLAPAGVGTVDQVLLAVLHSRHQSLRLLGLHRKVLIVDEVHACDSYMQGVLETLLEFHASVGGSAILLSATLPQRMKQCLIDAFARGCRSGASRAESPAYPLVTSWSPARGALVEEDLPAREDLGRKLAVQYVSDKSRVLDAIEAELKRGRCVCWMRNTVADAIAAYRDFQGKLPADRLTLFHARFALRDRLDIEERILACFGKPSIPEHRAGHLVIATQVAEQSLDADWDFVVSDLAPIDRLIQRAGRLRRHPRDPEGRPLKGPGARDQRGKPYLWVLGPAWTEDPKPEWFKEMFRKAAAVYPHHGQLWLTAKLLQRGYMAMPSDARELIEYVFGGETEIPDGLRANASAAEGREYADTSVARQNTVKRAEGYVRGGIDWWGEGKTPSRLGEASVTVVLGRWEGDRLLPWAAGLHGWAYSSVRVAERLIAESVTPSDAVRAAVLEEVRSSLPGKGQWSVLLPLEMTESGWAGEAWNQPSRDGSSRRSKWLYDTKVGLRQQEQSDEEDE